MSLDSVFLTREGLIWATSRSGCKDPMAELVVHMATVALRLPSDIESAEELSALALRALPWMRTAMQSLATCLSG